MEKELRIGNWVRSVKFNTDVQVELSDFYDLCANSDGAYNHPPTDKMFAPIPLNEDWLLDLEFEDVKKYGNCDYQKLMPTGLFFCIHLPDYEVTIGQLEHFSHDLVKLKWVHKLMNLYFELSEGEELIRKQK